MFWMMIILAAFAGALVVTPCNYCPGQCGVKIGKRKKLSPEQVAELQSRREQGVLIKTLMKEYDLSKTSIYRYLSETAPTPYAPDS